MKILQVDGDGILYRAGFAGEDRYYEVVIDGEEEFGVIHRERYKKELDPWIKEHEPTYGKLVTRLVREPPPKWMCLKNIEAQLDVLSEELRTGYLRIHLSGDANFRHQVCPTYKGNRKPEDKPYHYDAMREFMFHKYPVVIEDNLEADDTMAIEHMLVYTKQPDSSVIVTQDKDLNMIPGLHYDFVKQKLFTVTEADGFKWFYTQLLTGDTIDNIPGLPGCGPKTAERIIGSCTSIEDMQHAVAREYIKRKYDYNYLQEQATLLYILKHKNDYFEFPPEVFDEEQYGEEETCD